MQPLAVPAAPVHRRALAEEVMVVLALSLLQSSVRAIVSLVRAPVSGVVVAAANQSPSFVDQLIPFLFGLAPVLLVLHLVRRSGEGVEVVGLGTTTIRRDVAMGAALFAVVGIAGLGVYFGAVALGVNRFVVPAPPAGFWWTYPAIVMNATEAAVLEEVIVVGYLITRLQQLGWGPNAAVGASALLRGSYHLYQGWGGFAGNLAMGVLFGWLFTRTRRVWPFIVAHFLIDVVAAVGWLALRDRLPGF
jgi:membrane protease YdiL (CAAX protease family)